MWRIVLSHVAVAIAAWCATIHTTEHVGNAPTPPNTTESSSDARHVFSWATASEQPCADRMQTPIAVSDLEVKRGRLDSLTLHAAFSTFAACGVVVLTASNGSGLVPAGDVGVFRDALEERLKPSLSSRSRVRDALKMAMLRHTKLGTLWEETLQHESLFDASDTTRERSDGRIDVELPWESGQPFGSDGFLHHGIAHSLAERLLGGPPTAETAMLYKLHSVHGIVSLSGAPAQHWHRDNDRLFGDDTPSAMPPYALNVFVPLTDLSAELGPTEFALGSHTSIKRVSADHGLPEFPSVSFPVASGSIIMADYRTVHRGLANTASTARPVAMLIFARRWWVDAENYGDFQGGFDPLAALGGHTPNSDEGRRQRLLQPLMDAQRRPCGAEGCGRDEAAPADEEAMQRDREGRRRHYYGLSDSWQAGLARELDDDYRRGLITCSLDPETKSVSCDRAPVDRPADLGKG